ncbi:MAG: hypothetical protein ACTS3F_05165 [Phycisphaerales bacterium]
MPPPPDAMTWAYLLARWTEFARASVAFPDDAEGRRWKACIADIIALQAITHALNESHTLPADEFALAMERAELGITAHARAIHNAWNAIPLPQSLTDLIDRARAAHRSAASLSVELRASDSAMIVPDTEPLTRALIEARWHGTLRIAAPGTILFAPEPIAFLCPFHTIPEPALAWLSAVPGAALIETPVPQTQIYRQIDPESITITADLVAPLHAQLPPGRPLLLTLIEHARPTEALADHDPERWIAAQSAAGVDPAAPPPVRFASAED